MKRYATQTQNPPLDIPVQSVIPFTQAAFLLNEKQIYVMVSQNAIPSRKYLGGYQTCVFTEQGVAMLSTVLNSDRAIQVNIAIIRAFVKLREMLSTHKELAHNLTELEIKIERHDEEIKIIFDAIRQLMSQPEPKEKKIGFRVRERGARYRTSRRRKAK